MKTLDDFLTARDAIGVCGSGLAGIFSHDRRESFATHQVKKDVRLFMNCLIARMVSRGVQAQLFPCASATETAVMLMMPRAVTEGVRIWAGLAAPIRIGPTGRVSAMIIVIV